jgi:3alpha(or 20beta)-hydroxysteroid dehydrogenase
MSALESKRVLVTGAAQGLGAEIAKQCVEAGARVLLTDVQDIEVADTAAELGKTAEWLRLDVTRESDWQVAVDYARDRFGGLDGLVNNAAVLHMGPVVEIGADDVTRLLAVNVGGPTFGIKHFAPVLRDNGGGSIVNIASIDGVLGMNSVALYSATKFAVRGLTRSAALELGRWGVRVNAVCPAMGNPEMSAPFFDRIDVARYLEKVPDPVLPATPVNSTTVAPAVVFLLGDGSRSMTGTDLIVDAGWTAGHYLPGLPGF